MSKGLVAMPTKILKIEFLKRERWIAVKSINTYVMLYERRTTYLVAMPNKNLNIEYEKGTLDSC